MDTITTLINLQKKSEIVKKNLNQARLEFIRKYDLYSRNPIERAFVELITLTGPECDICFTFKHPLMDEIDIEFYKDQPVYKDDEIRIYQGDVEFSERPGDKSAENNFTVFLVVCND